LNSLLIYALTSHPISMWVHGN